MMAHAHRKKRRRALNQFANVGRAVLVGAATLLPERASARPGRVRAGTCLLAIKIITDVLKEVVPERRPDGEDDESFPSEHAAECIAAAMIIEREYPGKMSALAWGLAAAVSMSRVQSKKHHPRDVVAGAAIGVVAVWLSLGLRSARNRRLHSMG